MSAIAQEIAELWSAGDAAPLRRHRRGGASRRRCCEAAAAGFGARAAIWSSARGLEGLAPAAKDPAALLDALVRAPAPVLVVALDFHEALRDPLTVRRVRD